MMDPCFISICKFGSFKSPFATITSLSELYFRFRRFILLLQKKKAISMNYDSSTSSWKPRRWTRLDLILSMRDIYINSNLNPLGLKISSHGTYLKWSRRPSQSARVYNGKSMETETTTSEFLNGGKAIVEQILASEERKKFKRAELWESQSGIWVEKLTIWVSSFGKNYNRVLSVPLE